MDALDSPAFLGQLACLGAALLWAIALTIFRRPIEIFGARRINLAKCSLAAVFQGLTVVLLGQSGVLWNAPARSLIFIVASGLVGLVVGDTALFGATARIGVHRTLLLQTLAPVFTAIVAATWQSERPTLTQAIGGAVILAGVALVVAPERRNLPLVSSVAVPGVGVGIALGVLAAMGQGVGVVLAKVGMQDMAVLPASFLRLAAAAAGLAVIGALSAPRATASDSHPDSRILARVLIATLLGAYVALFLMMAGVDLAPASIAAVLLSTGPVFSLVLETVMERRLPTMRGVVGTLLAVTGVAVLSGW
jgi:drug/metabolite transporter (DMT)-like permease